MSDDGEDIRAAIRGDAEAMSRLWREHRRFAAAVGMAHGVGLAALEDLLQDVALTFVGSIGTLREPAAFRSWLRTIVRNRIRAARQQDGRRRMQPLTGEDEDGMADQQARAERTSDATRDRLEGVLAAIARMQPDYREPLLLRTVQGLSQQEIAAALDLPVTTIETRLARARRMLRASFDETTASEREPRCGLPGDR